MPSVSETRSIPDRPTPPPVPKMEEKPSVRFTFEDDDLPVDVPVLGRKPKTPPGQVNAIGSVSEFDYLKTMYASAIRKAEESKYEPVDPTPIPEYRIAGEIFASYIIVETEDKILMVDKHAAHERINFERLRANMNMDTPNVQMLLTPENMSLSTEETAFCEEYRKDIEA